MENNLVSVIIPAYNAGNYIEYTINSVLEQDYKLKEIIVIDDASTDDTLKIIESHDKFNCLKLICLENNLGVCEARNIGVKASTGGYIAFCDADDLWEHNKLTQQVEFLKNSPKIVLVGTLRSFIDSNGDILYTPYQYQGFVSYWQILTSNRFVSSSVMIRRDAFVEFDKGFFWEDYRAWLRVIVENGQKGYIMPLILVKYRIHNGQSSYNILKSVMKGVLSIIYSKISLIEKIYFTFHFLVIKLYYALSKNRR